MEWVVFCIIFWVCWYVGSCFGKLERNLSKKIESIREINDKLAEERDYYKWEMEAWKRDYDYVQEWYAQLKEKLDKLEQKSVKKSWKSEK